MKENPGKQLEHLLEIASAIGLEIPDSGIAPSAARAFAESLILCLSEDEASKNMQLDRAGAAAFLSVARYCVQILNKGIAAHDLPFPKKCTPFYQLASFAIEFLDGLRQNRPEAWR